MQPNERSYQADEAMVASLYRGILGREADPGRLANFTDALQAGTSLASVVKTFVTCPEYYAKLSRDLDLNRNDQTQSKFPLDYVPPSGEAGKMYYARRSSGFFTRFMAGDVVLDIGYKGYANPDGRTVVPHAIGVDLDYPGYDGLHLPFDEGAVDSVFSSHCLEHVEDYQTVIRDWFRVLKVGGFLVCAVPSQLLYERKRALPSLHNEDHKRFYTPSSLLREIEESLQENSYRVRHLEENDADYDYDVAPPLHPQGSFEIVVVLEKIKTPSWRLVD